MTIAIGIPTYNQAAYLARTIRSLLVQSIPPSQIIVSDNHSTDHTQEVLAEFEHQVTVISPPSHQSLFQHFNYVASRLDGEWIAILGSDDIAKPTFVERLLAGTKRAPDAVLVRAGYETIDGNDNPLATQEILSVRRVERWPQTLFEQLTGPRANLSAAAVRRSAWQSAGGFPEHLHLHADWAFYLRLCRLGSFIYEPAIISQYRVAYRPGIAATRILDQLEDECYIATRLIPELLSHLSPSRRGFHRITVRRAARRRFHEQLAHASTLIDPSDRPTATTALSQWALSTGCVGDLDAFHAGESLAPPRQIPPALKRVVRRGYSRLSAMRRSWFL